MIRLIDVATGVELQRLDGDEGVVGEAASFSQDGSVLFTAGSSGFVGWDLDESEMLSPVRDRDVRCQMIVYAELIDAVLCPTSTGPVIAFDVESGNEIRQFDAQPLGGLRPGGESRWNEIRQGDSHVATAPRHSSWSGASMVLARSTTSLTALRHRTTSSSTGLAVTLLRSSCGSGPTTTRRSSSILRPAG